MKKREKVKKMKKYFLKESCTYLTWEISGLNHEILDNTMKGATNIVQWLPWIYTIINNKNAYTTFSKKKGYNNIW